MRLRTDRVDRRTRLFDGIHNLNEVLLLARIFDVAVVVQDQNCLGAVLARELEGFDDPGKGAGFTRAQALGVGRRGVWWRLLNDID